MPSGSEWSRAHLLLVAALLVVASSRSLLSRLLLLLVLVLGLALLGQRLLQDLEDLLVGDLLVALDLAQVGRRRRRDLLETVLGDGCRGMVLAYRYSTINRRIDRQISTHPHGVTYLWSSVTGRRARCPCRPRPRTAGRRCPGRTRRRRPWRRARPRAAGG